MNKKYLYIIIMFFPIFGFAQTVRWATPPTYYSLEEYMADMYKIRQSGKVGLADISGKELVPAAYDSITVFSDDGYALLLNREAGKWTVCGILNQRDYKSLLLTEKYFLTKYPFFSEGKLCVANAKGEQGFIGLDGRLVIKCRYEEVRPFYEGRASVGLKNKRVVYINEDGNIMLMEPGEGVIIFGSSFRDGEAVVYTMNRKGYVINREGKTLRSYDTPVDKVTVNALDYAIKTSDVPYEQDSAESVENEGALPEDEGFSVFVEKGLYGYRKGGMQLLPAQFGDARPFRSGYAKVKVKKEGKYGILKLVDGAFSGSVQNSTLEVIDGKPEMGKYTLSVPAELSNSNLSLYVEAEGGGRDILNANSGANGIRRSYLFLPEVADRERVKTLKFSVYADDLFLWQDRQELAFSYPILVKLSEPMPGIAKADRDDNCIIYAEIENSSSQSITIRATFYVDGKAYSADSVTVAAGDSARVQASVKVEKEKEMPVYVVLSNGLKGSPRTIRFETFY